jgi:hypothetical protein
MTVLHQKEYEEAVILMNEVLHGFANKNKLTILILSELLFLAIHELSETPIELFKEACALMSNNYEKNYGTILTKKKKL